MTSEYTLQRQSDDGNQTFGQFLDTDNSSLCFSLELPWKDNHQQTSCVTPGRYLFYTYESPTKGKVWRTDQVPDRTAIEIHSANFASQLLGCIAPGMSVGAIGGVPAVLSSKEAFSMLQSKLEDEFYLTITGVNNA